MTEEGERSGVDQSEVTTEVAQGRGPGAEAPAVRDDTEEPFPRGLGAPKQSPLFWVAEKDRYLRQLMIRDIEQITGRRLLVYFADGEDADPGAQILSSDDVHFAELLGDGTDCPADLLIETDGGSTDATEKLVGLLRTLIPDLRAIVPRRAKSNGTLLALAAGSIVMGTTSELGPIDPFVDISPEARVPAHILLAEGVQPLIQSTALYAIGQTKTLAGELLRSGMLKGRPDEEIDALVAKLASRDHYHSHGSVIDADEAARLGLVITRLSDRDPLWQKLWLLRCMYAHDLRASGYVKIFEGRFISNTLRTVEKTRAG